MDPAARPRSRRHCRLPSPACLLGSTETGRQAGGGRPAAVTHDQDRENLEGGCRSPKPMKASALPPAAFRHCENTAPPNSEFHGPDWKGPQSTRPHPLSDPREQESHPRLDRVLQGVGGLQGGVPWVLPGVWVPSPFAQGLQSSMLCRTLLAGTSVLSGPGAQPPGWPLPRLARPGGRRWPPPSQVRSCPEVQFVSVTPHRLPPGPSDHPSGAGIGDVSGYCVLGVFITCRPSRWRDTPRNPLQGSPGHTLSTPPQRPGPQPSATPSLPICPALPALLA